MHTLRLFLTDLRAALFTPDRVAIKQIIGATVRHTTARPFFCRRWLGRQLS